MEHGDATRPPNPAPGPAPNAALESALNSALAHYRAAARLLPQDRTLAGLMR